MQKTNALRMLERAGVPCRTAEYPASPTDPPSGVQAAALLGLDAGSVYKTLVTEGAPDAHFVFVIPVARELDLKKAAHAVGEKKLVMLPQKKLLPLTGYVHGGCSPVGMKKTFPTVLDSSAEGKDRIWFSAGRIGMQVEVSPADLPRALQFVYAPVTADRD